MVTTQSLPIPLGVCTSAKRCNEWDCLTYVMIELYLKKIRVSRGKHDPALVSLQA